MNFTNMLREILNWRFHVMDFVQLGQMVVSHNFYTQFLFVAITLFNSIFKIYWPRFMHNSHTVYADASKIKNRTASLAFGRNEFATNWMYRRPPQNRLGKQKGHECIAKYRTHFEYWCAVAGGRLPIKNWLIWNRRENLFRFPTFDAKTHTIRFIVALM